MDKVQDGASERARLAINHYRETTADTAALAAKISGRSEEVLGQSFPAPAFFSEGLMTEAFRKAEGEKRVADLNPRLAVWASADPVNAIMVREYGEELGFLGQSVEALTKGGADLALTAKSQTFGYAADARKLARAEQARADSQRTLGEIAADTATPRDLSTISGALGLVADKARDAFDPTRRLREAVGRKLYASVAPSDAQIDELRKEATLSLIDEMAAKGVNEAEYQRGQRVTAVDRRLADVEKRGDLGAWERFGAQMGALIENPADGAAWLGTVVLESAPSLVAGAATTLITKSPMLGAGVAGVTSGGMSYGPMYEQIAKDAGFDLRTEAGIAAFMRSPMAREMTRDRATAYAMTIGVMDTLSGGVAGKQLVQSPMGELLAQGIVQAVMGSSGEALALLAADQKLDPFEIAIEGLAELVTVPIEVFGVGGQALNQRRKQLQETQTAQSFFEALASNAENSELKAKLPEKYREAVAELTKNGPVESVQIDTAGLDQLMQSGAVTVEDVSKATGLSPEQIAQTMSEGGDITIPTADYATRIAGTDMDKKLREHMRINGSATLAEVAAAQDADSQTMKDLETSIKEVEAGTKRLTQTLETARTQLVDELQAAGRAPGVASAEATQLVVFAEVMAKRLNMPVEEFLAENPLPRVFRPEGSISEVAVEDLTTLRAAGGNEAAAIEAAATAAGLTEDATNEELADALRTFAGMGSVKGTPDVEGAPARMQAREALSRTLNQSSVPIMGAPLRAIPTGGKRGETITIQDIARAFTDDALARNGRRLDPLNNMEDRAMMIADMKEEIAFQLKGSDDSGDQWYVEDVAAAMAITVEVIPELKDDPVKRMLFLAVAALLSPQNNPTNNWEDAVQAFSGYLRTGELVDVRPTRRKLSKDEIEKKGMKPGPEGKQLVPAKYGVSSGTSLPMLTFLIKQRGEEGALKWLMEKHTPKELAEFRRATGIFKDGDQTRKWQEYLPSDITPNGKPERGMAAWGPKVSDFMLNATGIDATAVTVDLWLMRTFGRHRGTLMDAGPKLLAEGGINDQPTRGDRQALDIMITQIADDLGKSPSSIQALLWYYEQKLWRAHGAKADSKNFKQGAERAAGKRGFNGSDIDGGSARLGGQGNAQVIARSESPATEDDLFSDLGPEFFGKPGWATLTADDSTLPDSIRVRRNQENEARLIADFEAAGIPYRRVTGYYGTPEPERSFVIIADAETAAKLGRKYNQDSVLTRDGLVYTTNPRPNTPPTGEFLSGRAAMETGFYSRDDSGRAYAMGLNFDAGPGVATMPPGTSERADRPQLPIRDSDGKVALYHWSNRKLKKVDPAKAGTGPLKNAVDAGVEQSFWGINPRDTQQSAGTGYVKEPGLGDNVHMALVDPDQLYPWFEDPDGLRPEDGTDAQRDAEYRLAIEDAGYLGAYFTDDGSGRAPVGNVAVLYKAVPVTQDAATIAQAMTPPKPSQPDVELNQGPLPYKLANLEKSSPGPVPGVRELATEYMKAMGLPVRHQAEYVTVDVERAKAIAELYDKTPDAPTDPEVRAAYEQLAKETIAQYEALQALGLTFDWIEGDDPYSSPADAIRDMQENKHLWVFPTTSGFGTVNVADDQNPLLQLTDVVVSGRQTMVNDLFRIVHDVFGHGSEGASFGPRGEENAWQAHVRMFSPLAARAMTSETRGQNSWVNYGPFGEQNRKNPKDTVYADQKTLLLPEWVSSVGQADDMPLDANGNPAPAAVIPEASLPRGTELFQRDLWDAPAFKAWFKSSKVVDKDGNPLVVYHGTLQDFSQFRTDVPRRQGDNAGGEGFFFVSNTERAGLYAGAGARVGGKPYVVPGGNVLPVFISLQNPEIVVLEKSFRGPSYGEDLVDQNDGEYLRGLKAKGRDGLIVRRRFGDEYDEDFIVAFDPAQIKSLFNSGAFDAANPDILAQGKRGSIVLPPAGSGRAPIVNLFQTADLSTVLHESGHYFLYTFQRLIQNGKATPEIVADYEALKAWWAKNAEAVAKDAGGPVTPAMVQMYLKKGTVGDATLDQAIYVGMHEQYARAYEAYLFEGKSPSDALSRLFDTFSSWLLSVYRKVTNLNVKIDDDIRGVFDRMLATDEEIAKAKAKENRPELIAKTAKELGITDAEYVEMVKLSLEAQDEARRTLLAEIMAPMQAQLRAEKTARKAALRDEVERDVRRKPVHRVIQWLGNERWLGEEAPEALPADLRLDRQLLIDTYGAGITKELPKGKRPIWKEGTNIAPDEVAMWFGFPSGDAMIQALKATPKLEDEIEATLDARLRAESPDPLVDGTLPEKALSALQGEKRGELIAAELKALGRRASKSIPRTTLSAAREAARRKIAVIPIRQAILFDSYRQASARAATRAQQALAKGDFDLAYEEKRKEMLNHALFMEARKAADEVEKLERKVARLKKPGTRKNIDGEYLAAIDEVLDRYDFRKLTQSAERRRGALAAYIKMMTDAGRANELSIPQSVIDETKRRPYKTLPYNELRGIADTLANIEHTGRRKKSLIDAKRQRDLDASVEEVVNEAALFMKPNPVPRMAVQESGVRKTLRAYANLLLNADTLLRELGGWTMGKAYDLIKTPIDEAANTAQIMRAEAAERIEQIYSVYDKDAITQMNVRKDHPALKTRADRLAQFNHWDLISMALNMGNEDNLGRLMDKDTGFGYTQGQIDYIKGQLTDKDWDFVESVWTHIDEYWPLIAAREKRQTGVVPTKVEALPFDLPRGRTIKGGYFPIKYDSRIKSNVSAEQIAELQMNMLSGRFGKAQTRHGHTKERANGSGGRVLQLGMEAYHSHLNQVIHDLAYSEAVNNAWRILQHPEMVAMFERNGRTADREALELWVQDVATGTQVAGGVLGSFSVKLKNTFTLSKLAFNLSSVLIQFTGVAQSMVVVGKVPFLKALAEYYTGPGKWLEIVKERSAFMRERETTFHKDILDMQNETSRTPFEGTVSKFQHGIGVIGFWMMTKVQFYGIDMPTWLAAYNNAVTAGKTDEAAVHEADRMVARAQASGLQSDRSAFERGTLDRGLRQAGFVRLFTALGSYMFAKGNIAYERVKKGGAEIDGFNLKSLTAAFNTSFDLALLFTLEAILYNAIKGTLPGMGDDDDDEDGWAEFLAKETALSIMSTMPILRDVGSMLGGFEPGGAYGSAMDTIFMRPITQFSQAELDAALLKSVSNAVGAVTGLPSAQANRLIDGLWRMSEGEDVAPIEFIMGRRQ
jgi:hypothetical protein